LQTVHYATIGSREAAEKEEASRRATNAQVLEDAERLERAPGQGIMPAPLDYGKF